MRSCVACEMEFETVEKFDQHSETIEHRNHARAKLGLAPTLAPAVKRSKSKKRSKFAKELENAKKWLMAENLNLPPELRIQLHSNKTHGIPNVSPSSTSLSNVIVTSKSTENLLIKSENDLYINPADYTFSSEEVKIKQEEVKLEPIEERIKTEN